MLRSTLLEAEDSVYCLAWGGASASQLLICSGSTVSIRQLQGVASGPVAGGGRGIPSPGSTNSSNSSSNSAVTWKAHDGVVLKADWSTITGLIITGGEDCRYKVRSLCLKVRVGKMLHVASCCMHDRTAHSQ